MPKLLTPNPDTHDLEEWRANPYQHNQVDVLPDVHYKATVTVTALLSERDGTIIAEREHAEQVYYLDECYATSIPPSEEPPYCDEATNLAVLAYHETLSPVSTPETLPTADDLILVDEDVCWAYYQEKLLLLIGHPYLAYQFNVAFEFITDHGLN